MDFCSGVNSATGSLCIYFIVLKGSANQAKVQWLSALCYWHTETHCHWNISLVIIKVGNHPCSCTVNVTTSQKQLDFARVVGGWVEGKIHLPHSVQCDPVVYVCAMKNCFIAQIPRLSQGFGHVWKSLIVLQRVAPEQLFCVCTRMHKEAVLAGEVSQAVGR